jgi:acyl-CoA thioester hydrolase
MGVVYYANYLEFFERSRTELLRSAGLPYRQLESEGIFFPVSEVQIKYFASACYDDLLTLKSCVSAARGVRLEITTCVFRGDELLVRGTVTLACVDRNRKPVRLPESIKRISELYKGDGDE